MKKLLALYLVILIFLGSCKNEGEFDCEISEETIENAEYQNAVDLIYTFYQDVNLPNVKTKSTSSKIELTLRNIDTHSFSSYYSSGSTLATKSGRESQSINLYTFDLEVNGTLGFAIASGDERIGRVYAYVENGTLADTSYIYGMAEMIRDIPEICEQDLEDYENSVVTNASVPEKFLCPPIIKTLWHQRGPYNLLMPTNGNCSQSYYYAGCGVIALAQVVANYGKSQQSFDFQSLTAQPQITVFSDPQLQNEVARFTKYLGDYVRANYGCSGTSTNAENIRNVLRNMGYNCQYDKRSDVNHAALYESLRNRNVVLPRGTGSEGHMWIFDGLYGLTNVPNFSLNKIISVHCNWGWAGSCDGWYAANGRKYYDPNYGPSNDPAQPGGSGTEADQYQNDNAAIHIYDRNDFFPRKEVVSDTWYYYIF